MRLKDVRGDESLAIRMSPTELRLIANSIAVAREFIEESRFFSSIGRSTSDAKLLLAKFRSDEEGANSGTQLDGVSLTQEDLLLAMNSLAANIERVSSDDFHTLLGSTKDDALKILRDYRELRREVLVAESGLEIGLAQAPRQRVYVVNVTRREVNTPEPSTALEVFPTQRQATLEAKRLGRLTQNADSEFTVQAAWWYPEGLANEPAGD